MSVFKAEVWTSGRQPAASPFIPTAPHLSWISCYHIPKTLLLIFSLLHLHVCVSTWSLYLYRQPRGGGVQASGFLLSLPTSPGVCSWARCCQSSRSSGENVSPHPSFARLCVWTSRYTFPCIASSAAAASLLRPSSSFFLSIYLHRGSSRLLGLSPNKPKASPYSSSML